MLTIPVNYYVAWDENTNFDVAVGIKEYIERLSHACLAHLIPVFNNCPFKNEFTRTGAQLLACFRFGVVIYIYEPSIEMITLQSLYVAYEQRLEPVSNHAMMVINVHYIGE